MAKNFKLEIATPERLFFTDDIEMVIIQTPEGQMGVLAGHQPMVVAIAIGSVLIKKNGEWTEALLTEGFMEVLPTKSVILTDTAEWPHEIDERRAQAAKERAEERLVRRSSKIEFVRSKAALARAAARLKIKRNISS